MNTNKFCAKTDEEILLMMDKDVLQDLVDFNNEFNKRECFVRVAKAGSFIDYYKDNHYNHKEKWADGFVVNGMPIPYFHPNRSYHDEIIWLNNNIYYTDVSFQDKLLNSAIVKFYGPSRTLEIITNDTGLSYINFDKFDEDEAYKKKLLSNIENANGPIWGTTELRTSLQTASRNYARALEGDETRKMKSSDMIVWINSMKKDWVDFYSKKPDMKESFEFLTGYKGIGTYYGYHFSSNLCRMPEIGHRDLIEVHYPDLTIEHGNLSEDDENVYAGVGSSKTLRRLLPKEVPCNLKTCKKALLALKKYQKELFEPELLMYTNELEKYTSFGIEIACCQFNVFSSIKDNKHMATRRAKAPISKEVQLLINWI